MESLEWSDVPIYAQLVRELYKERCRQAHAATPDMIGCQWCIAPMDLQPRPPRMRRRTR